MTAHSTQFVVFAIVTLGWTVGIFMMGVRAAQGERWWDVAMLTTCLGMAATITFAALVWGI